MEGLSGLIYGLLYLIAGAFLPSYACGMCVLGQDPTLDERGLQNRV
jgi:hypothetical protein